MALNEEYVCTCMHVNILTLSTDKMRPPPPHIYTQIHCQSHTLELLCQSTWVLVGSVLFSEGPGRNLFQCSICTKGL